MFYDKKDVDSSLTELSHLELLFSIKKGTKRDLILIKLKS